MEDYVLLDGPRGPVGGSFWLSGIRRRVPASVSGQASSSIYNGTGGSSTCFFLVLFALITVACLSFSFNVYDMQTMKGWSRQNTSSNVPLLLYSLVGTASEQISVTCVLTAVQDVGIAIYLSLALIIFALVPIMAVASLGYLCIRTRHHWERLKENFDWARSNFNVRASMTETCNMMQKSIVTRSNAVILLCAGIASWALAVRSTIGGCKSTSTSGCPLLPVPLWSPMRDILHRIAPQLLQPVAQKHAEEWFIVFSQSRWLINSLPAIRNFPIIGAALGSMADMQSVPPSMPDIGKHFELTKDDLDKRKAFWCSVLLVKLINLTLMIAFAYRIRSSLRKFGSCISSLAEGQIHEIRRFYYRCVDDCPSCWWRCCGANCVDARPRFLLRRDEESRKSGISIPYFVYIVTHYFFMFVLMNDVLERRAMSKQVGMAWEYYDLWVDWIRMILLGTAGVKYMTWHKASLQDSTLDVALMFAPVIGNEFMLVKESLIFTASLDDGASANNLFSSIIANIVGVAGWGLCAGFLLSVTLDPVGQQTFVSAHLPILAAQEIPVDAPTLMGNPSRWIVRKMIQQATQAKLLQGLHQNMEQAFLELLLLVVAGAESTVVLALGTSLARVAAMIAARRLASTAIQSHDLKSELMLYHEANGEYGAFFDADKTAYAYAVNQGWAFEAYRMEERFEGLSCNVIKEVRIWKVTPAVRNHLAGITMITSLTIGSKNHIGADGCKHLASNATIKALTIEGNDIGADGCKHLASNATITALTIGDGNNIGADGCKHLASNATIKALTIGGNNDIGADGCKHLASNATITALTIGGNNNIGADGCKHLASNATITALTIGHGNNIGADGCKHLASNATITALTIGDGNNIGYDGCKHLASNVTITSLTIGDGNNIDADGCMHFASNATITSLKVAGCRLR